MENGELIVSRKILAIGVSAATSSLLRIQNYSVSVIVGTIGQIVYCALSVLWPQQITALYTTHNATIGWILVSNSSP